MTGSIDAAARMAEPARSPAGQRRRTHQGRTPEPRADEARAGQARTGQGREPAAIRGPARAVALALALLAAPAAAQVEAPAAPAGSEATTLALIRLLVEEGILSRDKAQALLGLAEQQAAGAAAARAAADAVPPAAPGTVRVPYVPEVVRKQIRDEVKQEVLAQAKTERWGDPGSLPEWLERIRVSGDVRVRYRRDAFDNGNDEFFNNGVLAPDFDAINDSDVRRFDEAGSDFLPEENRTQDNQLLQLRARLSLDADLANGFSTGVRLATGNQLNPVSTNESLDTALGNENFNLDRAFIQYQGDVLSSGGELRAQAGRFGNPFFATDLLFDEDLNFDGVAARYAYPVSRSLRPWITAGYFPLEYLELSSQDKILYAAQIGADWQAHRDVGVRLGAAYYDYDNYRGESRECDGLSNRTVPARLANGNTLFDISCVDDPLFPQEDRLQYGLASDFRIVNLTGQVDVARFEPIHVIATGDVAINTGYSKNGVERRAEAQGLSADATDGTGNKAYMARLLVGHPEIQRRHEWNTILTYKYLETDSTVAAFTDSDFHLGGTNAKGYSIFGNYGVADRVSVGARWYSSDEIDGLAFGVDTFMLELNARF